MIKKIKSYGNNLLTESSKDYFDRHFNDIDKQESEIYVIFEEMLKIYIRNKDHRMDLRKRKIKKMIKS